MWGITSKKERGRGGVLSGIVSQMEKRFPTAVLYEDRNNWDAKTFKGSGASSFHPSPATQNTHRVCSKRHRSDCSYRPAQPHLECTVPT